ncbi:MAG: GtrA family protein [Deltaproteobacteria bacterium]|nr:GtrA family protein [Deltaproteobacteria bacterium]
MNALRHLLHRVTTSGQRRFLKFCIVGASGVPVNLAVTWLGHAVLFSNLSVNWRNAASFLLGIAISIFTNFLLNDLWTWGDHREESEHSFLGRLARFYFVCSLTSGIQFGAAMALTTWLALHYLVAQLIGIALATAVNFAVNNLWTFKNKDAEASPASPPSSSTE